MAEAPKINITIDEDALRKQVEGVVREASEGYALRLLHASRTLAPEWWAEHDAWMEVEIQRRVEVDQRAAASKAWDEGYTVGNAHNGRRDQNPYRTDQEAERS